MKFKSDIEVQAGLKDSSGANGASGQVLSSNGSTVSWVNESLVASDVQNQVKAGVAINKGQAVYVTGADGTNIIVGLASNTTEATSSKTLGLLNATVAVNGFADVVQIGRLEGLNTSAATVGDPVWLGTNGNLIYGLANKPYAPAHLVFIGVVTRVNANNGEIFINVQNGFELNEIHDVDIKTDVPINGDVLGYNGTLWVNKTIAEWLGFTPVTDARTITINGTTQDLSANRSWSVGTVTGTGTTNYIPKFTGSSAIGNSAIYDNSGKIGIGTTTTPYKFNVYDTSDGVVGHFSGGVSNYTLISFKSNEANVYSTSLGSYNSGMLFRTGTTDRMYITSGGNVGIGTTSPSQKLTIGDGTGTGNQYLRINSSATDIYIGQSGGGLFGLAANAAANIVNDNNYPLALGTIAPQALIFGTTNTERMRIFSSGNVFIGAGANDNGAKLNIRGPLGAVVGSGNSAIRLNNSDTGAWASISAGVVGVTNDGMQFSTDGTSRFVISSAGNLLIGTTTDAGYKLDVNGEIRMSGTANAKAILGGIAASWGGSSQYPTLYGSDATRWVMHINPHISYTQNGVNGYTGAMNGSTVRFASDASANNYWDIGVGTNSVGTDKFSIGRGGTGFLTINNSGAITANGAGNFNWEFPSTAVAKIGAQGTGGSLLVSTPSLNSSYESGFAVDGTYSSGKSVINLTAFGVLSGGPYGADMAFRTTSQGTMSEKMRITSGGDVGIGISPQWDLTTYRSLEIGLTGLIYARTTTDSQTMVVGSNLYYNGGWKAKINGAGSLVAQNAGNITFETSNSVTANSAATITERMRIFNNGNVLIGSSGIDTGFRLDVDGSMRVGGGSLIYFNTTGSPASNLIGTVNDYWLTLQCNRGNASRIDLTNGSGILFTDNGAERMSIASTGVKINNLAGTGTRVVTANASGVLSTMAGGAAPRYSSYIVVSHSSYTNICTINGDALASAIKMSFQGTSGGVVVNTTAEILVNHYQDISITSNSGFYSQLNIRIVSNNNESYSIEAQVVGAAQATGLNIEVFPLNNEAVTFQGTLVTAGTTLIHTTRSGMYISSTGGNQGDISAGGSINAAETISSNGNATFGAAANRPVNYDSNGGNFRIRANAGGWAMGYFFDGSSSTYRGGYGAFGSANDLTYYWIGSEWNIPTMVIQPSQGYVGVGTVSPTRKLHVVSSDNEGIFMEKSTTGGHWFNFKSADSNLWSMGAQPGLMGWYNRTDSTYKMVITDSGNVLIGTTTDAGYKLDVNGKGRFQNELNITLASASSSSPTLSLSQSATSGAYGQIAGAGDMYHGMIFRGIPANYTDYAVTAGDYMSFYEYGGDFRFYKKNVSALTQLAIINSTGITATGFFNSSDNRLKDLTDYDYNVSDIKPITYLWKDGRDNKKHVGYSAQEVQKVMPDAVNEDEKGFLSVNYVEVLVAKIAELENRIKQLEK